MMLDLWSNLQGHFCWLLIEIWLFRSGKTAPGDLPPPFNLTKWSASTFSSSSSCLVPEPCTLNLSLLSSSCSSPSALVSLRIVSLTRTASGTCAKVALAAEKSIDQLLPRLTRPKFLIPHNSSRPTQKRHTTCQTFLGQNVSLNILIPRI
jgi:hypothetical protein